MTSNMKKVSITRLRAFLALVSIIPLLVMPLNVDAAGLLGGRVIGIDMNGNLVALPRATVTVYAKGAPIQSVSPGFDGSYSMSLPSGIYVVTAEHPGFNAQSRIVEVSDWRLTPLDFYLMPAPAITGNVFDFSLSSRGPITVLPGELGWTTIQVTLRSGLPQMVNLSVSGLPSGAVASLSPAVGSPSFASICIITTSLVVQTGSYNVTMVGAGGGLTRSTSFTLTISPRLNTPDKP
jgi:hypothetical protein